MFKLSRSMSQPSKTTESTDTPIHDWTSSSYCASRQHRGFPVLNSDVIYLVMEHAYYNEMLLPDFKQLVRYALVARAWRKPAQSLLFHEVTLRDDVAYKSLSYLFEDKSEHVRWLANCVRVLNFWITATARASPDAWERRLPGAMNWFPMLYELRLGVDVKVRLAESTMNLLNSTPPIRALQIAMRSDVRWGQVTESVLPFQILTVTAWKLQFLVMRGDVFNLAGYTGFPPVTHEFIEFRWSVAGAMNGPLTEQLITYVTANSLKTLEVLHIPAASHPVVTQVAPTLCSLKVTSGVGIPQGLPHLKELIITDPFFNYFDASFYGILPPNITHFGISSNKCVDYEQLEALNHSFPPKLDLFSVYCEARTPICLISPLNIETHTIGNDVQVRVFKGKQSSRVGMRSDLVQSTMYPRGVSVENMRSMSRLGSFGEV